MPSQRHTPLEDREDGGRKEMTENKQYFAKSKLANGLQPTVAEHLRSRTGGGGVWRFLRIR